MTTNQRVKEVRQALGLSQAKFAKAISISNGYIAAIELGNRTVNDRLLKLIAAEFDVEEKWLKTGEGAMFKEQPDRTTELAFATFRKLKPEYQQYILHQIDELLKIQEKEKMDTPASSGA
ncbi:MAG: helix-turn-helix domain-containing protein [Lachnospiraceae bacterium]|nr:helix-turn-helix domain-containing protein [Lachnospiraceae bacterium]